jgi:hypothetical protein
MHVLLLLVQPLLLLMRVTAACYYCCNAGVLQEWAQIFKTGPYEAALLVSFSDEGTVSGCGWTIIGQCYCFVTDECCNLKTAHTAHCR